MEDGRARRTAHGHNSVSIALERTDSIETERGKYGNNS